MRKCLPFLLDPRAIKLEHAIRMKNRTIALIVEDQHFRINVDDIDDIQMVVDDANEQNQQQIPNEDYFNFGGRVEEQIGHANGNIANGIAEANADNADIGDGVEEQVARASDTLSGNIEFSVEVSVHVFNILLKLSVLLSLYCIIHKM